LTGEARVMPLQHKRVNVALHIFDALTYFVNLLFGIEVVVAFLENRERKEAGVAHRQDKHFASLKSESE
jgi:hypothetical protein